MTRRDELARLLEDLFKRPIVPLIHLNYLVITFRVSFPDGEAGDRARAVLPDAVQKSHDRLCTVSRTIELGTPITNRIE